MQERHHYAQRSYLVSCKELLDALGIDYPGSGTGSGEPGDHRAAGVKISPHNQDCEYADYKERGLPVFRYKPDTDAPVTPRFYITVRVYDQAEQT